MSILRIFAADGVDDDKKCVIVLINDEGRQLLKSYDLTTPPIADDNSKTLRFEGPTSTWNIKAELDGNNKIVSLEQITTTDFEIYVELDEVKNALRNVSTVDWDPDELDPEFDMKNREPTKTKGWPGS